MSNPYEEMRRRIRERKSSGKVPHDHPAAELAPTPTPRPTKKAVRKKRGSKKKLTTVAAGPASGRVSPRRSMGRHK